MTGTWGHTPSTRCTGSLEKLLPRPAKKYWSPAPKFSKFHCCLKITCQPGMCKELYRLIWLEFITMMDAPLTNFLNIFKIFLLFLVSYRVLPNPTMGLATLLKKWILKVYGLSIAVVLYNHAHFYTALQQFLSPCLSVFHQTCDQFYHFRSISASVFLTCGC